MENFTAKPRDNTNYCWSWSWLWTWLVPILGFGPIDSQRPQSVKVVNPTIIIYSVHSFFTCEIIVSHFNCITMCVAPLSILQGKNPFESILLCRVASILLFIPYYSRMEVPDLIIIFMAGNMIFIFLVDLQFKTLIFSNDKCMDISM